MILLIFFVLIVDSIWLFFNKNRYNSLVQAVQHHPISLNILGALLSYICVMLLIIFFAIPITKAHVTPKNTLRPCIIYGGGLGLLVYGVFNATNAGIFKKYDPLIALMDTVWGGILFTLATFFYLHTYR